MKLIETRRVNTERSSCNICPFVSWTIEYPVIPITEVTFKTSESTGMTVRYCDKHLAEMIAELNALPIGEAT